MTQDSIQIPRLAEGLYRLNSIVVNPNADRRKKSDWTKRVEFPAITYRVRIYQNEPLDGMTTIEITPMQGSYTNLKAVIHNESNAIRACASYIALSQNLVPVETPTLKEILNETRWGSQPEDVLNFLFVHGKINVDQVREACKKLEEMTDEERDALEKKAG